MGEQRALKLFISCYLLADFLPPHPISRVLPDKGGSLQKAAFLLVHFTFKLLILLKEKSAKAALDL